MKTVLLAMALFLAGCASDPKPDLSPLVADAYRDFLADPQGASFAVSEDGMAYGYSICEFDICWGNGARVALDACEKGGSRCMIYRQ